MTQAFGILETVETGQERLGEGKKPAPSSIVRFKIRGKSFSAGQRDLAGDLSTGALLFTSQGTYIENKTISPRKEER